MPQSSSSYPDVVVALPIAYARWIAQLYKQVKVDKGITYADEKNETYTD